MFKIPKQEFTAEFKQLAVKRVQAGESVGSVARDLGLVEQTLRNWVKLAKAGKLPAAGTKAVTPEQMELSRVRAENARLRMENEILETRRGQSRLATRRSHESVLPPPETMPSHVQRSMVVRSAIRGPIHFAAWAVRRNHRHKRGSRRSSSLSGSTPNE